MRLMVVATLLCQALSLAQDPDPCQQVDQVENVEYRCQLPNATMTFDAKNNDYINVICEGTNVNCTDIPRFTFASGQPLDSLGVKDCPPRILRCINDVLQASSMDRVTLVKLAEPLVEEDVEYLGNVSALTLRQANKQTAVPVSAIRSLPTLREVRLGGGNMELFPHMFEKAPPLTYLEFGEDNLPSIPPDAFNGLANLVHLNIWGNNIANISVDAFKGLENLRQLSFNTNKLKSIEPGTFASIPKLEVLYFRKNQLSLLPDGLLEDLKELQNLILTMNEVELSFGTQALSQLPSLKHVNLEYNYIRILPEALFNGSTKIESLHLNNNKIENIPSNIFSTMPWLKILDLSKNSVKELPSRVFYGLKKLEYLYMNYNHLESLPGDIFSGLNALKEIHFDHNSILSIASSTFRGPSNLQLLSLGYNKLSLQAYDLLESGFSSPFNSLLSLRRLNLTGNQISTIFEDWRLTFVQLEDLNLSYNKFEDLTLDSDPNAFFFLSSTLNIDLRHNEIRHISLSPGPYRKDPKPSRTTILLNNNPIICDCHLYGVKLRVDGNVSMFNEPRLIFDDARCFAPEGLKGNRIVDVPAERLVCNLTDTEDSCSTLARPATNELLLDCSNFPSVLPDVKNLYLREFFLGEPTINVKSKFAPKSLGNLTIHTLDLSNNSLSSLDFTPSKYLKVLNVSNNNIKTIPMAFLKANVSLYVSNNSLDCSCFNQNDIFELKSYEYIDNATCYDGRKIKEIDVTSLCDTQNAIMVAVATFTIIAIFAFILSITVYLYFNEIIVYMISRGICKGCVKGTLHDKEKEYDAFVSFSHDDFDLVTEKLLPILENEFCQKVCVHYRDWIVGDPIPDQIIRSVAKSRKTIIILSESFLKSTWSNQEFFTAHNLSRQENSSRIILILMDEKLKQHPKMSAELKAYISTNTYLLWGDPNFTKKLGRALERVSYRITWLDALRQKSKDKPAEGGLDVQLLHGKLVNMGNQHV